MKVALILTPMTSRTSTVSMESSLRLKRAPAGRKAAGRGKDVPVAEAIEIVAVVVAEGAPEAVLAATAGVTPAAADAEGASQKHHSVDQRGRRHAASFS